MNVIVKMKFGSHLYGTDTPESDQDFKGVYQAELSDIVLNRQKDSIVSSTGKDTGRNTKEDVDIEFKELRKFIKDAISGQTYALDMLYAPDDFILETSNTWKDLVKNRHRFLSNDMAPFVGYCRQQAGKYGLRGSRLGELLQVIEILKSKPAKDTIETVLQTDPNLFSNLEFVKFVNNINIKNPNEIFLDVLGKKFSVRTMIKEILLSLEKMNNTYGGRARLAMENKGVDWKAISHAYRCMYQLRELKTTKNIVFPLKEASYLKRIKSGEIDYAYIQEELYCLMEEVVNMPSDLPEKADKNYWDKKILEYYYL